MLRHSKMAICFAFCSIQRLMLPNFSKQGLAFCASLEFWQDTYEKDMIHFLQHLLPHLLSVGLLPTLVNRCSFLSPQFPNV